MELEYAYLFTSCAFVVKPLNESPLHLSFEVFKARRISSGKRTIYHPQSTNVDHMWQFPLFSLTTLRKDSNLLALLASLSCNSY